MINQFHLRILYLCLVWAFVPSIDIWAQCTGGVNAGAITPTAAFQTIPCVNAGQYYTFNATAGNTYTFTFCNNGGSYPFSFDTYLTILTNAGVPVAGAFNDNFCFPIGSQVTWTATSTATFRILISLPPPGCGSNATCATLAYNVVAPFGPGATCANPQIIGSLPYTNNGLTTCGAGDDFTSAMACTSTYMDGDDYVFRYTSPGNECINVALTGTTNWTGLFVLNGCPSTGGTTCIAEAESGAGNPSLSWVNLTAAGTYYIVVSTLPPPQCTPFNIAVSRCPTGRTCADPRVIPSLPYTGSALTTCGFGDDYDATDACTSSFMDGDDFVFSYTTATARCIDVYLSNTLGWTGVFIMNGCPDAVGTSCIGSNTSIFGNPPLSGVNLPAAGTYYIVVSTDPSPQCTPFDIRVDTCTPPTPCGLNPPASNSCLSAVDVSGYPSFCGNTDTLQYDDDIPGNLSSQFCATIENNSWFSFVASANTLNFFFNVSNCYFGNGIQARVFSTSDCLNFTAVSSCFNPMTASNGSLTASGLTIGQTYYLMIDGYARDDCEFSVTWNGGPLPVEYGGMAVVAQPTHNVLNWSTLSEAANVGFDVQRGVPAPGGEANHLRWTDIGFVGGAMTTSVTQRYVFSDSAAPAVCYYRLRQIDQSGQVQYSDVVEAIRPDVTESGMVSVAPNPARDAVKVSYITTSAVPVSVEIFDMSGKRVAEWSWADTDAGYHAREFDVSELPEAMYLLRWSAGMDRATTKLMVRH